MMSTVDVSHEKPIKKLSLESLAAKFQKLEDELREMRGDMASLGVRTDRAEKRLAKTAERLMHFEPHQVERDLDSFAIRTAELASRLQAMILRITVCTEIAYSARILRADGIESILTGLIELLDEPDDFWLKSQNRTIGDWIKTLGASRATNGDGGMQ